MMEKKFAKFCEEAGPDVTMRFIMVRFLILLLF